MVLRMPGGKQHIHTIVVMLTGHIRDKPQIRRVQSAEGLLEEASKHLEDKKFDLAEAALSKLDGMKDSLPESLRSRLDALHAALKTAKAAKDIGSQVEDVKKAIPGL